MKLQNEINYILFAIGDKTSLFQVMFAILQKYRDNSCDTII